MSYIFLQEQGAVSSVDNFSDIPLVGIFVIEPKGWTSTHVPLSGIAPVSTFFSQGVDLNVFLPFPATNLQQILVL